ncbi:shikimate dehydrogenase [Agromyces flavus]|uniref:Shikimate dehydrogenase n=1 Tax=Agromyces flavus TaxID=589382 RepID=A0A1H1QRH6_9MICO|nr:shikimate dehydrogenase [Agromyces flavus]MCP2367689.1 shikimate dehydrogenase [Agromyces flavus]GGI47148.1 shikimate 5-dehydrogenase [Agromyces flavus]SDS26081.1 shikimate dehydrogenase [Agromyces flavus]
MAEPTDATGAPLPRGARRPRRLAVLGSPIAHSKSPALHRAAYDRLGLTDWAYERAEVGEGELAAYLDRLGPEWRGLSLTMPLKPEALEIADDVERLAERAGAVNTLLLADDGSRLGFNTDIGGIVRALADAGINEIRHGVLVGGGATAASALIAMAELGALSVEVCVRDAGRAASVVELGHAMGLVIETRPIARLAEHAPADLVISTVPGGTDLGMVPSDPIAAATLLDVAYAPWPTLLASSWLERGGRVVHGLEMLLHQALLQVRIFVGGDPLAPLPDEEGVLDVMRRAL